MIAVHQAQRRNGLTPWRHHVLNIGTKPLISLKSHSLDFTPLSYQTLSSTVTPNLIICIPDAAPGACLYCIGGDSANITRPSLFIHYFLLLSKCTQHLQIFNTHTHTKLNQNNKRARSQRLSRAHNSGKCMRAITPACVELTIALPPRHNRSHGSDASNKCSRSQQTRYQIKYGPKNVFRMGRKFNFLGKKAWRHEYLMLHLVSLAAPYVDITQSSRLNSELVYSGIKQPQENPINRQSFARGSESLDFFLARPKDFGYEGWSHEIKLTRDQYTRCASCFRCTVSPFLKLALNRKRVPLRFMPILISSCSLQDFTLAPICTLSSNEEERKCSKRGWFGPPSGGQMAVSRILYAPVAKRLLTWILIVIIIHFADCLCCLSTARGTTRYVYTRGVCFVTQHFMYYSDSRHKRQQNRDVSASFFPWPTKGEAVLSPTCLRFAQCLLRINCH